MEIFVNDLSFHEQFHEPASFRAAFARLMAMREVAQRYDRDVYCHRTLLTVKTMSGKTMHQTLQSLGKDKLRAAMLWLTKGGPFWDDLRRHGPNDWLECRGDIVTDSAVGEAAYRALHGSACGLVSAVPSDWDFSPVEVAWRRENESLEDRSTAIENWRDAAALESGLRAAAAPLRSWDDLSGAAASRFPRLTFAGDCFEPLAGHPFAKSAAERIHFLLDILDRLADAFDATGARTPEGHRIYRDYFRGRKNALFSDSSVMEKRDFSEDLKFPHPNASGKFLFCTWHGKVNYPSFPLRLHYWWSRKVGEPVYVVYIGPKITRR